MEPSPPPLLLLIKPGRVCTERWPRESSRSAACLGGEPYCTTAIKFLVDRIPAFRCIMESPGSRLEVAGHLSQYLEMEFNYLWGNLRSPWFQIAVCTLGRTRESKECGKAFCRIATCQHGRTHLRRKSSVNAADVIRKEQGRPGPLL